MNIIGQEHNGIGFLREIARGVRSRIFLVSHKGQICAAKLFLPEYSQFAEREYSFGSFLLHPNLNQVFELIQIKDYNGVLMPYVAGKKLSDYYGHDFREFLKLFQGLLRGLAYLHEQDIIHRDIKPENVIVVGTVPKLLDFDLARRASEPDQKEALVGTIAYFSPEVVQGQAASQLSDLYSAAIILYRALTGEVPFIGTVREVIHAQEHSQPLLPSSFSPDLAVFDAVLMKALAKDPKARYDSVQAFIDALEQLFPRALDEGAR